MLRRWSLPLFVAVLSLPLLAFAQVAGAPDPSQLDAFLVSAIEALGSHNYTHLAALGVIGGVYLLRQFAGKVPALAFFTTDRGGAVLVLLTSIGGALLTVPAGSALLTIPTLIAILKIALEAAGGYSIVRKLMFGDSAIKRAEEAGALQAAEIVSKQQALDALRSVK